MARTEEGQRNIGLAV